MRRPAGLKDIGPLTNNDLLRAVPPSTLDRLLPQSRAVSFPPQTVTGESDGLSDHVHFVLAGLCSLVTPVRDGGAVACAAVGSEGLLGAGYALAGCSLPLEAVTQTRVLTLNVPADVFRRELARDAHFRTLVNAYLHALVLQIVQMTACNRLHSLTQRFCRWLLLADDRLPDHRLEVTQERLASILGARRPSLTVSASELQRSGLIAYRRGRLAILDRAGLEAAACECYGSIRAQVERLNATDGSMKNEE